jgi:hypothetical protein
VIPLIFGEFMFTFIKKDGREVQVNIESIDAALAQGWVPKEEKKDDKKDTKKDDKKGE